MKWHILEKVSLIDFVNNSIRCIWSIIYKQPPFFRIMRGNTSNRSMDTDIVITQVHWGAFINKSLKTTGRSTIMIRYGSHHCLKNAFHQLLILAFTLQRSFFLSGLTFLKYVTSSNHDNKLSDYFVLSEVRLSKQNFRTRTYLGRYQKYPL